MRTSRLEAFSDGVLAIIITIMVLELRLPPHGKDHLGALVHTTGPSLLTYLLSFIYIGIYWNNHHHLFMLTRRVTGGVLWANLHLLFWLSLYPLTTSWMDETALARDPMVVYGVNLLGAAVAYYILQATIVRGQEANAPLKRALGRDLKGKASPVLYVCGILAAWFGGGPSRVSSWVAVAFFVAVAVMWLVPDPRLENAIVEFDEQKQ